MERFMDFMMTHVLHCMMRKFGYIILHGPSLGNLLDQISTGAAWPRPRGNLWRDMRRWVETGDGEWRVEWRIGGNWIIHAGSRLDARPGQVIGCADWFCCGQGQGWWQCACVTVTIRCTASLGLLFKYLWRQVSFASLVSLVLEEQVTCSIALNCISSTDTDILTEDELEKHMTGQFLANCEDCQDL